MENNQQLNFIFSFVNEEISIDKVSKLKGHTQLRETQIYVKIVNEELDRKSYTQLLLFQVVGISNLK